MILSCKDAEECDAGTKLEAGAKECVIKEYCRLIKALFNN